MSDLHDLLQRRAEHVLPAMGLADVYAGARRRTRRRRRVTVAASVVVAGTLLTGVLDIAPPGSPLAASPALAVRQQLGIFGITKHPGGAVVVRNGTAQGKPHLSIVTLGPKAAKTLTLDQAKAASVSPKGDVATVTSDDAVEVVDADSGSRSPVLAPAVAPSPPTVSWDRTGNSLFALVDGRWLEIRNPGQAQAETITQLRVPTLPGRPTVLSISPSRTRAVLFGVTTEAGIERPVLYLGTFDGTSVAGVRTIAVPRGAVAGPMGWLGENAFLLAPAPGQALIVRTDRPSITVYVRGIPDPCAGSSDGDGCTYRGPRLLGTNGDGSMLFWRVAGVRGGHGAPATFLVRFYRTWLDGSHALRLSGLAGRYGPAVAPR